FGHFSVAKAMLNAAPDLPEDPALLKAMIAALQAENAKLTTTLRAHDLVVQALRLQIARLKKQAFGKSSEKIEREIAQLELALSTLTNNSPEVGSPAISVQGSCDDSGPEQVEAGPTIHGSLDELELVDLAFYRSGAPGRGQCSAHRIEIAPEATSE